ncbi:MAG: phage portal protein [Anaerolineaceae bacterium]|nr:phage portal protein [Anaerolineaceae bacterium]
MGFVTRLLEKRALDEHSGWGLITSLRNGLHSYSSATGLTVTPERALQITAVYAAVRILAEGLASLPLPVYKRLPNGGKERDGEHSLYKVLHDQANEAMTAFQFKETMMGHLCLWGNAYAEIQFDGGGHVRGLWPLRPDETEIRWVNGKLFYVTTLPKKFGHKRIALSSERVFHLRGLSMDGIQGMSPIKMERNALGLAAATEEYGSRFFGNGAKPGGVLEHPQHLSDEAHNRVKGSWEEMHQGLENSHRVAILEEGMQYKQVGIPPEDAQFLETRKFQVSEIARIFRVPPHMLADLERATFSNIEQQSQDFLIFTLQPWLVRWEQELKKDLFTQAERKTHFAEFLVAGLLRGDTLARYQSYAVARQNGWLSANDVRKLENMNPVKGGDVYLVPLNMVPAEQAGEMRGNDPSFVGTLHSPSPSLRTPPLPPPLEKERGMVEFTEQRAVGTRRRVMVSYRGILQDAAGRVIRREVHDLLAGARRNFKQRTYEDFANWMDDFFEDHQGFVIKQMRGAIQSYAEMIAAEAAEEVAFEGISESRLMGFVNRYLEALASRHVFSSRERVNKALGKAQESGEDPVIVLEGELNGWPGTRPAAMANAEATRVNGAVSELVFSAAGIFALRWKTFDDSCPYCASLSGKIVERDEFFLLEGEEIQPEGAEKPLKAGRNLRHPPAHGGCDCMVTAGV